MCGIVWARQRNGKSVTKRLRKLYHAQSGRGTQGFGFVEVSKSGVGRLYRTQEEHQIMSLLSKSSASEILFHHRFPTSTPNTAESAHPIPVSHKSLRYDYLGVHNGVVSNTEELEKKYSRLGFPLTTTVETWYKSGRNYYPSGHKAKVNDSEYLMIDLALAIEAGSKGLDSRGSIAFVMLQVEKGTGRPVRLYYGRNHNPLKMEVTEHAMSLSSAGPGEDVEAHKLHCIDYATGEISTLRDFDVGFRDDWDRRGGKGHTQHTAGKRVGQHYDRNHDKWRYDDEIEEKLAGYSVPTQRSLPAPAGPFADVDDEDYGLIPDGTLIPGHETAGLTLRLSGETRILYFLQELEYEYINLVEEIEYWKDRRKANAHSISTMAECNTMLAIYESDEKTYRNALREYAPEAFEDWKEPEKAGTTSTSGATTAYQEPII